MTLSKVLGLKRGFLHHKVAPQSQKCTELAKTTSSQNHPQHSTFHSVRGSDSCYIGNQPFYFIKQTWVNLFGLYRWFLHHKVATRPQIRPELAKKTPSQNHIQNRTFRSLRGSDSCYIGNQPLYCH